MLKVNPTTGAVTLNDEDTGWRQTMPVDVRNRKVLYGLLRCAKFELRQAKKHINDVIDRLSDDNASSAALTLADELDYAAISEINGALCVVKNIMRDLR